MATGGERDPLGRVEPLMDIITRAHAVIFTEHRRLVGLELADETTWALLNESVRIVFERAPEAARAARTVAHEEAVRRLLDPAGTPDNAVALERVVVRAEELLGALLRRQQEIADELAARGERKAED